MEPVATRKSFSNSDSRALKRIMACPPPPAGAGPTAAVPALGAGPAADGTAGDEAGRGALLARERLSARISRSRRPIRSRITFTSSAPCARASCPQGGKTARKNNNAWPYPAMVTRRPGPDIRLRQKFILSALIQNHRATARDHDLITGHCRWDSSQNYGACPPRPRPMGQAPNLYPGKRKRVNCRRRQPSSHHGGSEPRPHWSSQWRRDVPCRMIWCRYVAG